MAVSRVDHVVLTTADIGACAAFYEALGFTARETGGRWELHAGGFKLNVHLLGHELEPKAAHVRPGSADLCFEVEEPLDFWREKLAACGIGIELDDVVRTGSRGLMRSLYLRDPDGNLIELCSYRDE